MRSTASNVIHNASAAVLVSIVLTLAEPIWATVNSCAIVFAGAKASVFRSEPRYDGVEPFSKDRDINIVGTITGPLGGSLRIMEGQRGWFDLFPEPGTVSLRGNPRWALQLAGKSGAAFLGFRIIAANQMTGPDAAELNHAVALTNKYSVDSSTRINIKFYTPKGDDLVGDKMYVDAFLKHRALPIAKMGVEYAHDVNFHLLSVFYMPEPVIAHLIRQNAILIEYTNFLKQRYGSEDAEKLSAWEKQAYSSGSLKIDSATSELLMLSRMFRKQRNPENPEQLLPTFKGELDGFKMWMGNGKSAIDTLLAWAPRLSVGSKKDLEDFISMTSQSDTVALDMHSSSFRTSILGRVAKLNELWARLESRIQAAR